MIAAAAAIARKELRALVRSWGAIALTLAVPLVLASLIGAGFPNVDILESDEPFQTSRVAQAVALEIVFILGFALHLRIATVFATRREEGRLKRFRGLPRFRRLRLADVAIVAGLIAPFLLVALLQLVGVAMGTMFAAGSWPRQPMLLVIALLIAPFFFTALGLLAAGFATKGRTKLAAAIPFAVVLVGSVWVLFSAGPANALHLGVPGAGIAELVRLAWTADLPAATIAAAAGRAAGMSLIWTAAIAALAWRTFRWEPTSR